MQRIQQLVGICMALVVLLMGTACAPNAGPAAPAPAGEAAESATGPSGSTTFVIDPAQSSVRFILDELLRGQPTTVVGEGSGISGEIRVDVADPSLTSIGPITIDARTLATDSGMRNQAIGRFILQHNQDTYRYITFTPTAIEGLPDTASVGQELSFDVTGDLTIRDVTQPVTFAVTVVPESETLLRGSGQTQVLRSDYDLQIPNVPSVANVTDEVQLEIDFIAVAE